ncbi:MAG: imidazolonepropionase [Proteobacteria bacterium]|nr:imidazolonepropionase [Pseudomonadota bacterium]
MPFKIISNATLATMRDDQSYGLIPSAAIAIKDGEIAWLGPMASIPDELTSQSAELLDCGNRLLTPGLIDCHTHIVYAGDRATEFEKRLQGASYEEIAQSGGGINSTVVQTREACQQALYAQADSRLSGLMNEGVTTLEIKSGYGLDSDNEIKMLKVADQLAKTRQIRIQKTFLGAHSLPPEYAGQKDAYIDHVCNVMLPAAFEAGLVDAVDGFCESIAFSVEQMQRVFDKAQSLGLAVKLHAEQLSHLGSAVMAAQRGALSVDHIEFLRPDEARLLAENKTVAVLLPGAFYTLNETQKPPVEALREHKVPIAIATDLNPGSSPLNSLLLAMNMACTLFSLTPVEALAGTTINAAKALGLEKETGSLEVGKSADLVIWDTDNPAMLAYQIGANPCLSTMVAGEWRKNSLSGQERS